jgi:peptidoglycan hydrolase-like protein with peptidoglycan-binding domain
MTFQCGRFSSNADMVRASQNMPPFRQGSKGEGVRVLQMAFIDLGFAMPRSTNGGHSLPDGIFGSETVQVTIAFQKANLLKGDGIVGTQTLARLDALMALKSEAEFRMDALRRRKAKGD